MQAAWRGSIFSSTIDSHSALPLKHCRGHSWLSNIYSSVESRPHTSPFSQHLPSSLSRFTSVKVTRPSISSTRYEWWRSGRSPRRIYILLPPFFNDVFTDDCGPCRWVPHDIPRRGPARALSQDVVHASRHEQLRAAVRSV
ncbi:hypothetical protein V8E53_008064 [Lactarius tabidus]